MKKIAAAILVISMLVFGGSAMACEYPGCEGYTWSITYNPDDFLMTAPASITYTFDLTTLSNAYVVGVDHITSAYLTLWVYDDADRAKESFTITLDGTQGGTFNWNKDSKEYNVTTLLQDGTLVVTLTATSGDFYFDKMELDATGADCSSSAVPEPSTMLLLGFGLIGTAVARKKFKK